MANQKISELTAIATIDNATDVLPIVDTSATTTKKITLTQVKTSLALNNVDNTSDANKPVSTAQQTALDAKQATLVSATNIKTINSTSLLGSGDISISASPSGVSGAIQFSNGSAFASDASNLFWDDTNNRLGIGTNAPTSSLELGGVGASIKLPNDGSLFLLGTRFATNNGTLYFGDVNGSNTGVNLIPQGGGANGSINFGAVALAQFKGKGSTSATTSLLVQNSAGSTILQAKDNGDITVGLSTANINVTPTFGTYLSSNGGTYILEGGAYRMATTAAGVSINKGATGPVASAVLEIESTTKGFLPPRMTTTQKNAIASPAAGLVVYDSTTNKLCCYNGSTWNDLF